MGRITFTRKEKIILALIIIPIVIFLAGTYFLIISSVFESLSP